MERWRRTRRRALATLALPVAMSLLLVACKDTKTLQENEQLKSQIADLQKQVGQMGNDLETVTAARDSLVKENETLKAELKAFQSKKPKKKSSSRKHR